MEKENVSAVSALLKRGTDIVNDYDESCRKNGLKYNVFKTARIHKDEVVMCRVLADLLNPRGSHCKGDKYLKPFWEIVQSKSANCPGIDTANAKVETEHYLVGGRIDIVIADSKNFVAMEVKIGAGELPDQIKKYADYSKTKNAGRNVPVLFLTLHGDEAKTAGKREYISVSFGRDILDWLEKCLQTEKTGPISEVMKQLAVAVKSTLGYSEDAQMEKAIINEIFQSEETMRAAAEIVKATNALNDENWRLFKEAILKKVQERLPKIEVGTSDGYENWWDIAVSIKNGAYTLHVNYDWKKILIVGKRKEIPASVKDKINAVMTEVMGTHISSRKNVNWWTDKTRYPGMETVDETVYQLLLYKKYKNGQKEVADYIAKMANKLEEAL